MLCCISHGAPQICVASIFSSTNRIKKTFLEFQVEFLGGIVVHGCGVWNFQCGQICVKFLDFLLYCWLIMKRTLNKNCVLFDVVQHHVVISLLSVHLSHQQVFPISCYNLLVFVHLFQTFVSDVAVYRYFV